MSINSIISPDTRRVCVQSIKQFHGKMDAFDQNRHSMQSTFVACSSNCCDKDNINFYRLQYFWMTQNESFFSMLRTHIFSSPHAPSFLLSYTEKQQHNDDNSNYKKISFIYSIWNTKVNTLKEQMQIFSMHMSNYGNTLQMILKFTLDDSRATSERKMCMRESERPNVQYTEEIEVKSETK